MGNGHVEPTGQGQRRTRLGARRVWLRQPSPAAQGAADPRFSVNVTGNQFSFPLPHPAAVKGTPSLRDAATPIYNASIAPDGTIKGLSNNTNTVMDGRVAGTRMTGQVYGLLCYYAFTADRN